MQRAYFSESLWISLIFIDIEDNPRCPTNFPRHYPSFSDVLWELCVHGLHSTTEVQPPATQLLLNLLTHSASAPPTSQHALFRALSRALFFLMAALTHIIELRGPVHEWLVCNKRFMTEIETVRVWLTCLFSRCEEVRGWAGEELEIWAGYQGFVSVFAIFYMRIEFNFYDASY